MQVKQEDIEWVSTTYPELDVIDTVEEIKIAGRFHFNAIWDEKGKQYIINPDAATASKYIQICDSYEIKIVISKKGELPKIYETGGRIKSYAEKRGKSLSDLHFYESNEICYAGLYDRSGISSLKELLDGSVLQYFYDQSYFERFGKWPRGEYSHGIFGVIENFIEQDAVEISKNANDCIKTIFSSNREDFILVQKNILSQVGPKGHHKCLCGSKKEFRECHNTLFRGIWFLHKYYKSNK